MKTSLKNLLLVCFLAIYSLAFSQSDKQATSVQPAAETWKVRFGIQFGMNVSNIKSKPAEYTDVSPRVGANIGTLLDIHIKKDFAIQTGMLLTSKGANYETRVAIRHFYVDGYSVIDYENANIHTMLTYLEIPANLLYNLQVGRGNFFFGTGPYFSYSVYSISDYEYETYGNDYKDISNHFDMGLNLLGGYEFDCGLYLKTGYAIGLKNISDSDRDEINTKNRCFDISIGCKIK